LNIHNLKNILDHAFRKLNKSKCKKIILVLGNTGCGKSTLLSSMVVGAKNMEVTKIKIPVADTKKGGKKVKERKVIDYKKTTSKVFPIGHSLSQSETFFPGFCENPHEDGSYLVDIAGLEDTAGPMIEYVNQFINKKVFSLAQDLKVLIFITRSSPFESRGA